MLHPLAHHGIGRSLGNRPGPLAHQPGSRQLPTASTVLPDAEPEVRVCRATAGLYQQSTNSQTFKMLANCGEVLSAGFNSAIPHVCDGVNCCHPSRCTHCLSHMLRAVTDEWNA